MPLFKVKPNQSGRIMTRRSNIIYLSVFMMALVLSVQIWGWYRSDIFDTRFKVEYRSNDPSTYMEDKDGSWLSIDDVNSTDSMPSICQFPDVSPFEPSVMEVAGLEEKTLYCQGKFLPDLTYINGSQEIWVNSSLVQEHFNDSSFQHCKYQQIFRHETDDNDFKYGEWSEPFNDTIQLPEDVEFLKVECVNETDGLVSKTFYYVIPKHEELNESDVLNLKKHQALSAPKETLSIIMIGMDTLTRHQFIRALNKTRSYLMNSCKSFDFTMHSQLGENTFPNFLPLFAGQSYEEITKWWSDEHHMDSIDLLWGTFEKAGYKTLYTEDWPAVGAFNYLKKGFKRSFARYNSRPLTLAMYDDKDIWEQHPYCVGNQVEMKFLLNYVSQFLDTFPDNPVFAVAMLSKPTHDAVTEAKMFDEHVYNFYRSLNEKGHMNRSLVISFSDHGVRWGPLRDSKNGNFESRTPYTILTFPDWFLRKYPDVVAKLEVNTKRLTTHFDTHSTLLDLLYFKSNTAPIYAPPRHGISLFEKIPWDRTCKDASIPLEYCMCGYTGLAEIDVTSDISQSLATLVVDAINSKTDKTICVLFKLYQIIRVLKIALNENNLKTKRVLFKVKLETTPGRAIFEANVFADENSRHLKVGKDINRLNLYRGQSDCINVAMLRPFCYCNNMLAN